MMPVKVLIDPSHLQAEPVEQNRTVSVTHFLQEITLTKNIPAAASTTKNPFTLDLDLLEVVRISPPPHLLVLSTH